jgi:Ni,Fe-hydrogenase III small subunit
MNAFLLSCGILGREPERAADVYMGSIIGEAGPSGAMTIAFGNCCPRDREYDLRIPGCPPYPFALKERLEPGRQGGTR